MPEHIQPQPINPTNPETGVFDHGSHFLMPDIVPAVDRITAMSGVEPAEPEVAKLTDEQELSAQIIRDMVAAKFRKASQESRNISTAYRPISGGTDQSLEAHWAHMDRKRQGHH
jgi:hypothetical protein